MAFKKGHKPRNNSRKHNYKQAVWDKCKECIYDPGYSKLRGWKEQVTECSSPTCPLYPVRPRANKKRKGDE